MRPYHPSMATRRQGVAEQGAAEALACRGGDGLSERVSGAGRAPPALPRPRLELVH